MKEQEHVVRFGLLNQNTSLKNFICWIHRKTWLNEKGHAFDLLIVETKLC